MDAGVDGWWPDQGDGFDGPSRLARHRMYWEGTQLFRPNERPFALHRNASAGIQRYGGFIWSGDVQIAVGDAEDARRRRASTPDCPVCPTGARTSAASIRRPSTPASCTCAGSSSARSIRCFRAHGRNWHLKLPWGWDGGDGGPFETDNWQVPTRGAEEPAKSSRSAGKYLELRYRLMPYLYTAVRECHDTGLPIMRALWLHHPDDATAVARGDEYLWGRDILVAPVVEKGATSRRVYLPRGTWFDFWTERAHRGRPRNRSPGRPRDDAALRARGRGAADGACQAVRRSGRSMNRPPWSSIQVVNGVVFPLRG